MVVDPARRGGVSFTRHQPRRAMESIPVRPKAGSKTAGIDCPLGVTKIKVACSFLQHLHIDASTGEIQKYNKLNDEGKYDADLSLSVMSEYNHIIMYLGQTYLIVVLCLTVIA